MIERSSNVSIVAVADALVNHPFYSSLFISLFLSFLIFGDLIFSRLHPSTFGRTIDLYINPIYPVLIEEYSSVLHL